jgi:hypothetical protein
MKRLSIWIVPVESQTFAKMYSDVYQKIICRMTQSESLKPCRISFKERTISLILRFQSLGTSIIFRNFITFQRDNEVPNT